MAEIAADLSKAAGKPFSAQQLADIAHIAKCQAIFISELEKDAKYGPLLDDEMKWKLAEIAFPWPSSPLND